METFREEHYEVEHWVSLPLLTGWEVWAKTSTLKQATDVMELSSNPKMRIIRCTTIREVVE